MNELLYLPVVHGCLGGTARQPSIDISKETM
jgi:hypothetical protein